MQINLPFISTRVLAKRGTSYASQPCENVLIEHRPSTEEFNDLEEPVRFF
jgi:hypothetical protein